MSSLRAGPGPTLCSCNERRLIKMGAPSHVTSLQNVFSILWLRLGLRQVVDTTDTRLPLWFSEDGAQETAAVLESSSLTLTACGRSQSSSNSSPPGPGTRQCWFIINTKTERVGYQITPVDLLYVRRQVGHHELNTLIFSYKIHYFIP